MKRSRDPDEGTALGTRPSDTEDAGTPAAKFVDLDRDASGDESVLGIKCPMPPHKAALSFRTYEEYETHYNKAHVNRCLECGKSLPSDHLLNVHIEECHDVFAAVKRERGEHTYSCFVEGCEKKCMTPQKRRLHLIDKHLYPKNFFFAVTKEGIDGRNSLLLEAGHRRRKPHPKPQPKESHRRDSPGPGSGEAHGDSRNADGASGSADREQPGSLPGDGGAGPPSEDNDQVMEGLTGAMSALKFIPPNIRFGRGGRGTGFSKK